MEGVPTSGACAEGLTVSSAMVRFEFDRAMNAALEDLLAQLPEILLLVLAAVGLAAGVRWATGRIDASRRLSKRLPGEPDGARRADPPTIS
jgi:hypothetical protein